MIVPGPDEIAAILGGSAKTAEPEAGFCDCHVRVLGPADRYPPALGFDAEGLEDFTAGAYRQARDRLGLERVVLVQPDQYGDDHACLIDAMDDLVKDGDGTCRDVVRGVASVRADVEDRALEDLLSVGITGTRFVMRRGAETHDWETIDRLAWRVHDFGWDVELEMDGADLHEVEQRLREWPGRIVLAHIGLFLRTKTLTQRGFKALTRLIDRDKVWVKLSAPYRSSRRGRVDDREIDQIARALVGWAPERMIWGSNWPHLEKEGDRPDDRALLDLLADWVPEESRRTRILRENPEALYGFESITSTPPAAAGPVAEIAGDGNARG
jgi:D-galactarolactone isomerase